ncbi:MAG: hypothetical protein K9G28_09220 [Candidatus Nanopelagicales bacterium]|nr:hypothetical protein [Candidatus Nanopelagicales bacterium]
MGRKSVDVLLSTIGLVLTLVFVVAGSLLMWGGTFAKDTVTTQLTAQNIAFDEDASKLPPELASWAGTAVVDGESARAYSDLIAVHIDGTTGGKSYSQVSGDWFADGKPGPSANQNEPSSYDIRMTAFMGETLRGVLLNAYAFWTMGTIAVYAAWASWVAALAMLVLTVLGFRHASKRESTT